MTASEPSSVSPCSSRDAVLFGTKLIAVVVTTEKRMRAMPTTPIQSPEPLEGPVQSQGREKTNTAPLARVTKISASVENSVAIKRDLT